jgi:hypothetical protein
MWCTTITEYPRELQSSLDRDKRWRKAAAEPARRGDRADRF